MPRYVIKQAAKPAEHDQLVKRLVPELQTAGTDPQPLILEEEIDSTGSRHVHVIWDRWRNLTDEQRAAVIMDAYLISEGKQAAENITIASGVTVEEALVLGLLPYKVVSARKRHENKPPAAEHKKALLAEARKTLLGEGAKELRYARLEDAEAARKRLEKALPGSQWAVVQEVSIES